VSLLHGRQGIGTTEGVYNAFPRVKIRGQMKNSWTLTMTLIGLAVVWNLLVFIGVIFLLMH
jgi:hypothetical protein